jgi:tripartite ATP-independent transporter DctM subunit
MRAMIIVWGFLLLIILLIIGVPVLYCFGCVVVLYSMTLGYNALGLLPTMYGKLTSFTLLSIPLFIMAGGVMEKGKIGDALLDLIESLMYKVRGSLTVIMSITCAVFGSVCGSGAATLSCIGSLLLPKMRDKKYPMEMMAAVAACSAPLGMLIPPSAIQIVIAWSANLSGLACFLSTVIPGIILTTLLSLTSWVMVRKNKDIQSVDIEESALKDPQFYRKMLARRTRYALPALLMPVIILGSIYSGIMTATESAAIAVFYAIPVAILVYKAVKLRALKEIFIKTATATGTVMVMVVMTMVMGQILTMENVPTRILNFFTSLSDNKNVILLAINVFLVVIGMIMDDTCATMLVTPMLVPLMVKLGGSPYQMAAILGVNLGMGNVTPPTAPYLYMSSQLAGVNALKVTKYVLILILFAYIPTLLLTTYVPEVSTFLPKLLLGSRGFR